MQVHTETLPFIIINISPVIFNNSLYHTYQVLTFHSIQLMHIFQAKTTRHKGINQIIVMWLLVMHARVILRFTSSFTTGHNSWLHSAMGGKKKTKQKKSPLWSSLIVMQDQGLHLNGCSCGSRHMGIVCHWMQRWATTSVRPWDNKCPVRNDGITFNNKL